VGQAQTFLSAGKERADPPYFNPYVDQGLYLLLQRAVEGGAPYQLLQEGMRCDG